MEPHLSMEGTLALGALGSCDGLKGLDRVQIGAFRGTSSQEEGAGKPSNSLLGTLSPFQRPKVALAACVGVVESWGNLAFQVPVMPHRPSVRPPLRAVAMQSVLDSDPPIRLSGYLQQPWVSGAPPSLQEPSWQPGGFEKDAEHQVAPLQAGGNTGGTAVASGRLDP